MDARSIKGLSYREFDSFAGFGEIFDLALNAPGPPLQAALHEAERQLIEAESEVDVLRLGLRRLDRLIALNS